MYCFQNKEFNLNLFSEVPTKVLLRILFLFFSTTKVIIFHYESEIPEAYTPIVVEAGHFSTSVWKMKADKMKQKALKRGIGFSSHKLTTILENTSYHFCSIGT